VGHRVGSGVQSNGGLRAAEWDRAGTVLGACAQWDQAALCSATKAETLESQHDALDARNIALEPKKRLSASKMRVRTLKMELWALKEGCE